MGEAVRMTVKRSLWVWWSIVSLFAAVVSSTAQAEPDAQQGAQEVAARNAFEAGREDYEHGEFARALAHFERAYALSPLPQLLFNIGRAADSDGQPSRAITAYTAYLDAFPTANNVEFVKARLAKMRSLERADKAATRDPFSDPSAPPEPANEAASAAARPADVGRPKTAEGPHDPSVVPAPEKRTSYTPAVVTLAAIGVASAGLFVGYGVAARRGYDGCDGPHFCSDAEFSDAYRKKVYLANGFGAAAVAAGTAATVLFLVQRARDKRAPSRVDVMLDLSPGHGKVVAYGAF